MRYLIFSDLHSNLESLQSFSEIIDTIEHDKKVFLGDLVGYGADPNACVNWVRENADLVLGGNHDYAVVGKTELTYMNPYAYQACLWTRQELTPENKEFLVGLPSEIVEDGVHWVHSSPFEPEQWHYVVSSQDGEINFDHFSTQLCFLGHSHRPVVIEQEQGQGGAITDSISPVKCELKPDHRYIVNVGSLGQPRDGNPKPAFVIYDSILRIIEFQRYKYDIAATQRKILDCGLPPYLAERLEKGV
jgi:diadenosine tetraphosphatase ApaH/serine/threonine PP2A family protein phosphatase